MRYKLETLLRDLSDFESAISDEQEDEYSNELKEVSKLLHNLSTETLENVENKIQDYLFYIRKNSKWASDFKFDFDEWLEDGNVIENPDGTYSTQDTQYKNRLLDMDALKQYFIKEFRR